MDFYHLRENIRKQFLNTDLNSLKTPSKKVLYKAGGFIGNKIADAVTKSNHNKIVNQGKRQEILNKLRQMEQNGTL